MNKLKSHNYYLVSGIANVFSNKFDSGGDNNYGDHLIIIL